MAHEGYHGGSSLQLQELSFSDSGNRPLLEGDDAAYGDGRGSAAPLTEEQQLALDMRIINEHPDKSTNFSRGLGSQEVAHRL